MNIIQAQRFVICCILACVCVVVLSFLLIRPKPPVYPHLAKNRTSEELSRTIIWHLENTPATIVNEIDTCVLHLKKGDILCDSQLFYKIPKKKLPFLKNILKTNKDIWPFIWSDANTSKNEVYFSRFSYTLNEIQNISKKQTVLGKQTIVEANITRNLATKVPELIGVTIPSEHTTNKEKDQFTVTLAFINHPSGLALPIKPLPHILREE